MTDISYEFTATGQLSGTANHAYASAELGTQANPVAVFGVTANGLEFKPLLQSGRLTPGTYRLVVDKSVDLGVNENTASAETQSVSAQCHFTLRPVGAPPPPSTPVHWINVAGGSFPTATNWIPQRVPGGNNTAIFDAAANYTVDVGPGSIDRLVVANGTVKFANMDLFVNSALSNPASVTVNNATLNLFNGELEDGSVFIAETGPATVLVQSGAVWTNSGTVRIGGAHNSNLHIVGAGKMTSGDTFLGGGSGDCNVFVGAATLSPSSVSAAEWFTGNMKIGAQGPGTLTIADGAKVESEVEAIVGDAGSGTLTVRNGGIFTTLVSTIGNQVGSVGKVVVTGVNPGTPHVSSRIGIPGTTEVNGTLLIEDGAIFEGAHPSTSENSGSMKIAQKFDGTVTVRGVATGGIHSRLVNLRDLTVGVSKQGTLTIDQGGIVSSGTGVIASEGGALGDVTIRDAINSVRSEWRIKSNLDVGLRGKGNLTVAGGGSAQIGGRMQISGFENSKGAVLIAGGSVVPGSVEVSGDLIMGGDFSTSSILTVDGVFSCANATVGAVGGRAHLFVGLVGTAVPARFTTSGDLTVGNTGTGTAAVFLHNGGIVSVGGTLLVGPVGLIAGNGTLRAAVRNGAGYIQPGLSPGLLTIDGSFEQTAEGTLRMEAAGLAADQFDVLHVTGDSTLGGTMEVTFLNGYFPKTGDTLPFLQVDGTVSGEFAQITFPQLAPGFQIKTEIVDGKYQLTALNDGVRLFPKGMSRGLVNGDPAGHEAAGFFTIRTTARGGFSARFVLGGDRFALRGRFDAGGKFSQTIPRQGASPLTVNFELSATDPRLVTGTIIDGEQTIPISADPTNAFNAKTNPAPQAGKYTALLPFDSAAADAPRANGVGTVVISTSGAVRFAGALADGTRLSQGTVLSASGGWPLYILLYKKQGSLFGELQFRDQVGSDFDGTLRWSRPPTPGDKIQSAGFLATLPTIGSRYGAPAAPPAVLDLPTGATATLNDADLTSVLTKSLTLTSRNKFVVADAGADAFSLNVNATNGLLSGRFIHPTSGLSTQVHGVIFQKQNLGSGFFLRPGEIGSFDMHANP